ncbi:hypothetical protein PMAYCL1PPCAC_28428, partial [Pristionchus mayeri]
LWRHGQRAPARINGVDGADVFHRGPSQLTDAGIVRSVELGQMLRRRYVNEHGLMSGRKEEKDEFSFYSTNIQRAKDTLQLVASGLFKEDREASPQGIPRKETTLNHLIGFTWFNCPAQGKIFQEKCKNY